MIILIAGISLARAFISNDTDNNMDEELLNNFERTFNKSGQIIDEANKLDTRVKNASTDFGTFGVLNSLISTSWQGLKLTTTSLSFMTSVFGGLGTIFGIPSWLIGLLLALVTVYIVYAIIDAIFGGTGR